MSIDRLNLTVARLTMTCTCKLCSRKGCDVCQQKGVVMSAIGTGFFWRYEGKIFIITNWHNVTGRNFEKPSEFIDKGVPDNIKVEFYTVASKKELKKYSVSFPVKNIEEEPTPPKADVVACACFEENEGSKVICVNDNHTSLSFKIAEDVFILGYPEGIEAAGFPIWKRGSIASEPKQQAKVGKDYFIVDSATRKGMSGSPVFIVKEGAVSLDNGSYSVGPGRHYRFVGVYSGRLGEKETEAQLGRVWAVTVKTLDNICKEYEKLKEKDTVD